MRRTQLVKWAEAGFVLSLGAILGTGCDEGESFESFESVAVDVEAPARAKPGKRVNAGPNDIPGEYIVVIQRGADPRVAAAAVGATPGRMFTRVLNGFAGQLDERQLEALERRPDVELIEPDQVMSAAEVECSDPVANACGPFAIQYKQDMLYWGVDRTDQREFDFSGTYTYSCTGSGVPVYVFDTGIETSHSQFAGRAHFGYDALGGDGEDCNGHGTHVAGLIAGTNYGVAKQAEVYSVRVLDCDGDGSFSDLIEAMEWVEEHGSKPAVANMSLSGFISWSVNRAANDLVKSGVVVVAAAGNNSGNACWYSPGGASRVMTAAACNTTNERASFSNYGSCVDIYAPGTNLKSAWLNNGARFASGTSMASPHVAGVAAMYLQALAVLNLEPSAEQIMSDIEDWATEGVIVNNTNSTPNLQLHWPCGAGNGVPVTQ